MALTLRAINFEMLFALDTENHNYNYFPTVMAGGVLFTTEDALDCRRGGLVTQRHTEIRDLTFDLSSLVGSQTIKEPIVQEGSLDPPSASLLVDDSARGVRQPQSMAMFDIRVGINFPYSCGK